MLQDLPRRISVVGAGAIMVGVIIGSGIFRTPPIIAQHLLSPAWVLGLWTAGGLLSLAGALTYAELAAMYPRSGGVYVFLHQGLGPAVAFVFGWTYMLITKPFAAAGIAVIFSEHLLVLGGLRQADPLVQTIAVNGITTVALFVLTVINVRGVGMATNIAKALTAFKIAALVAIVLLAVVLSKGNAENFVAAPAPEPLLRAIAPVMLAILWTYDGWSDVGAIAGEIEEPQRNIPRVYLLGTATVTVLYVAVNAVYIWLVPLVEMGQLDTVAPLVMHRLVGPMAAAFVTAIIVVSAIGSSHGSVLTGARVTFAQARDGLLFRFLGRIHPRYETPAVALWAQLVLSYVALWHPLVLGRVEGSPFQRLADGFTFTMWIFYGLAGLSIFILRVREPDTPRPYRCWGYPVVPALFILASAGMTVLTIGGDVYNPDSRGMSTLPMLAILAAGFPMYALWRRFAPAAT
jgi:basic amino acid/polyamine antiporter, APA family